MSTSKSIKETVRDHYASVAQGKSCCASDEAYASVDCCTDKQTHLSNIGYSAETLGNLPAGALEISAGCGNPTGLADIQPGETVLDLGSGGGIDALLTSQRVGPEGFVIGVDMTPAMIEKAQANAAKAGATNVEFRLGEIERLPVDDNSVDLIISNCVINLSPDKDAVFAEAFRTLKPGGRLMVSDIVTVGPMDEKVRHSAEAWAGCIAGALDRDDYLVRLKHAGFGQAEVVSQSVRLNGFPLVSANIRAVKPSAGCC